MTDLATWNPSVMNILINSIMFLVCIVIGLGCWLGWQVLRQNGRILLRLDELEKRVDELEFGDPDDELRSGRGDEAPSEVRSSKSEIRSEQSLVTSTAKNGDGDGRSARFSHRSLARSRIKRDGLKAGMSAPSFRLPRLDGGELSLEELRGKRVLLIFSDPHCGPCQMLAPHLEQFHREKSRNRRSPSPMPSPPGEGAASTAVEVVMISRGDPKENRAKVKEHGLTFPVVLQQRWEISRLYAMFATPVAYSIDEAGILTHNVVVGIEPILELIADLAKKTREIEMATL